MEQEHDLDGGAHPAVADGEHDVGLGEVAEGKVPAGRHREVDEEEDYEGEEDVFDYGRKKL